MPKQTKVVRDPVHGYIEIEADIMENIIDTVYFQRLRRIEQTSMRCVYPSARHDRFIHSIGTYYLAQTAVKALEKNIRQENLGQGKYPKAQDLKCIYFNFEIAALLHDIGHSPFSHTLESFFARQKVGREIISIQELLLLKIKTTSNSSLDVSDDFLSEITTAKNAPHEVASCIVIWDKFVEIIKALAIRRGCKADFEFIFRCILGLQYPVKGRDEDEEQNQCQGGTNEKEYNDFKNCIIQLLNSPTIDVDRLDYITRDSQISGYDNIIIDTKRLLSSLNIVPFKGSQKICIAFEKQAISIIHNVLDARNSLYLWIYAHHKVKYEAHILEKALWEIANQNGDFLSAFFSIERIEEKLLCDDDVWTLLQRCRDKPIVQELFCRSCQKKALWKSFAEFQILFANEVEMAVDAFSLTRMREFFEECFDTNADADEEKKKKKDTFIKYLENQLKTYGIGPAEYELVFNKIKLSAVDPNSIIVHIGDRLFSFDSLIKDIYRNSKVDSFFYLYIDKGKIKGVDLEELIKKIKAYEGFQFEPNMQNKKK